jgi:hypothetical protein
MTLRRLLILPALAALFFAWGPVVQADVLTTTDGLTLEGEVERLPHGGYRLTTEKGSVEFPASSVAHVKEGPGPRAAFLAAAARVDAKDVVGQYRLALRAEEQGLVDLARAAYRRVLELDADHPAARRALGYERLEGEWVEAATARRRKGLVLYCGRWMLPAEVESASGKNGGAAEAPDAAADDARARSLIRALATGAAPVQSAARLALAKTPDALVVRAALATLYDPDPKVRIASCRLLAEIGDEAALRPLILSGARDTDPGVRREATLAAAAFGHDDTAIPFVRALGSRNPRLAGNAAEALAVLGDQRAAGYIVKRLRSHGSSTRNFVAFLRQVSYVRDYDVEIAQASNIANPDVATISEGVILDVKVLDAAYTKTWVEPILVKAFNELAGQRLRSAAEVEAWYAENRDRLPDFPPKPNARAPRRVKGRVIGAQ